MLVLVLNSGSSTLKYTLFSGENPDALASHTISLEDEPTAHREAAKKALRRLEETDGLPNPSDIQAVGHRVVHGGSEFRKSVIIDPGVKEIIARLSELAPLHNPPAMAAIRAAEESLPGIPQIAVFDTAFFADLPPVAHIYPLPYEWYEGWGIRRFGFHGISHAYCAGRAAEMLGQPLDELRLVICHLGHGCSASAVKGGKAVATTMGFTPMEGLMMGARSGSIDPGIMLYLSANGLVAPARLETALNRASGLLGVSGISSDFRQVQAAAQEGEERAQLAIDLFADRVRGAIGSLAVNMGGLDALIFTAGIGENAPPLRRMVCRGLQCLGCRLDAPRNEILEPDADLAERDSPARILAIHTREDFQIAKEVRQLVDG